jgi:hypothetical protein
MALSTTSHQYEQEANKEQIVAGGDDTLAAMELPLVRRPTAQTTHARVVEFTNLVLDYVNLTFRHDPVPTVPKRATADVIAPLRERKSLP